MNILSLRGQGSLTANLLQHPRYRVVGSAIEPLEDRIALATLLWDGSAGDGDWFNAQNWDQNAVPGTGDSAILAISSTINLTTEATVGSFQQTAGTLTGVGNLEILGDLAWSGGTMAGTGTTSVAGLSSSISGIDAKILGRTVNQTGTITYSSGDSSGQLLIGTGPTSGVLNNSGTFNVTSGGDFLVDVASAGNAINNSGAWNVSGAGTTSNVIGIPFNNSGSVSVNSSTLALLAGSSGNTTGDFSVASGATVRLGGNFSLAATVDFTGVGSVSFQSGSNTVLGTYNTGASIFSGGNVTFNVPLTTLGAGTSSFTGGTVTFNMPVGSLGSGGLTISGSTVNFNATIPAVVSGALTISSGAANFNSNDISAAAINLSGGTLGGSASMSTSGDLTWTGGTMAGTGTTSVAGLSSSISGIDAKILGRTLNQTGTMTYSSGDSSGQVLLGTGPTSGVLNNSGTFNVTSGGDFLVDVASAGNAINNSGTWNVSGAGTTSNVTGIPFNNSASVNISSGTFALQGGFIQTAGITTLAGGALSTGATLDFQGGMLAGSGTITGNVNNSGGTVRPGGTGTAGTLTITGTYTQGASGTLSVEVGGTGAGQFDALSVGGTATLGGTLSATLIDGFVPQDGARFQVLTASPRSGGFAPTNLPSGFTAENNANDVTLVASVSAVFTWDGSDSSDWFDADNWTPAGVPAATDTAILDVNSTINLALATSVGAFNQSAGTFTGAGAFTILGDLTWTGGTMTGTGTTSVAGAASTISGGAQKGLDRTLTNTGTITFSIPDNSGAIIFGLNTLTPGALNNSGTFNVTAGGDFSQNVSNAAHAINNSGTWNVMGAGTTSTIGAGVAFNNTGAVNVSDGAVLALNGGGTSTGSFAISSGTTLEFGGGTHNLNAGSALSGAGTVEFGGGTGNFNAGSYNLTGMTSIRGGSANFNAAATTVLLNLSSGTLDGSAMLSVTGDLTWTGGTMTGTGTTSVAGAASTISGGAQKGLDRTLTNTGTITFSIPDNSGAIIFGLNTLTPGALNNSGTFNVTAGGDFSQNVSNAAHAINNSGTWNVMGAGTTSTIGAGVAFNNTGAVNVSDGAVLALNGGGTSTGSFAISSGTTLEFGGGTHNLNAGSALSGAGTVEFGGGTGNFNAGSYNLTGMTSIRGGSANFNAAATTVLLNLSSGTLDGSAMLSVTGDLTWTGGTMTGTGTTSVAGAASTISGGAQKGLDRTLTNTGTITFSIPDNSGAIIFGLNTLTPGALNNSGTFNVTAGGDFSQNVSNAAHAINNSGTWNVMGAGTTSTIGAGVAFNNTGAVNVSDGAVLALNGGGTSTGSFAISSGTTLEFGGGTHNLNAGSALSGAGTVEFGGGTGNFNAGSYNLTGMTSIRGGSANFNAAATTVLLNLSSGTLDGSAMLSVTGDLTWTGGTMTGTGTTSVAGAASTISGGAQKGLDRTLTNTGTITFSIPDNSGAIIFGLNTLTPGALNNSGTFNVTAGGDFSQNVSNAAHAINNSGTWNVMGAGTTSTTGAGVAFNNTGAVNVASGTLSLQGSFTQTAGSTLLEGGALSTGTTMNLQGGTLAGSGTITGNVHNSGGIVQPGGTGAAGTLAITDTYAQTGSGVLTAELGGTGSGQFDTLLVGEIATLGGTLGAALINGFAPAAGDVFNVVVAATRSGTFSTLNAPGSLALEYTATQAQLVFAGALPLLSINDASVIESASGTVIVSFNIRLSAPSSQPVTVQYATADGTATASEDYGAVSLTTVTFAPGEILKTVDVAVSGDTLAESLEVFAINLSNPTNATLLDPIGQGAIIEFAISGAGKSATFVEVDGDRVTFEVSGGALSASNFVFSAEGTLQKIDLTQGNFSGANITARAQQNGGGDGLLNVGAIDATGLTLGKVRVTGDLGQIDVGDGSGKALKALTVGSLGALGATTQAAGTLNPLLSEIRGILPKLTVQRDVMNAIVEVSDKLGKVRIGGSLIDSGAPAPTARAAGSIGVFLNGGIPPVGASRAGTLFAPNIGPVTIAGDINGGEITAEEEIKSVKIVGRLVSLDPLDPAVLRAGTAIDKIIINDDVQNALILAGYNRSLQPRNPDASIGKVVVNGDWTASSVVAGVADPTDNGFGIGDQLVAGDTTPALLSRIASVIIKGTATGSATATDHSAITAQTIGTLRIAGAKLPLTSGANNILLDPLQQNFRAVEL